VTRILLTNSLHELRTAMTTKIEKKTTNILATHFCNRVENSSAAKAAFGSTCGGLQSTIGQTTNLPHCARRTENASQRLVHSIFSRKRFGYVGIQYDNVRSTPILFVVLSPNAIFH